MSGTLPAHDPVCLDAELRLGRAAAAVAARATSADSRCGGCCRRRRRRLVGPFIFFDHFGPVQLPAGQGLDVRPHPHIGAGHGDLPLRGGDPPPRQPGLGAAHPAGRHQLDGRRPRHRALRAEQPEQERRAGPAPARPAVLGGAAPRARGGRARAFSTIPPAPSPPCAGPAPCWTCWWARPTAPAHRCRCSSPTLYVHARLEAGARLPIDERLPGARGLRGRGRDPLRRAQLRRPGPWSCCEPGSRATVEAEGPARVMIVGGDALDGDRHVWWNFVSSSLDRHRAGQGRLEERPLPEDPRRRHRLHPPARLLSRR